MRLLALHESLDDLRSQVQSHLNGRLCLVTAYSALNDMQPWLDLQDWVYKTKSLVPATVVSISVPYMPRSMTRAEAQERFRQTYKDPTLVLKDQSWRDRQKSMAFMGFKDPEYDEIRAAFRAAGLFMDLNPQSSCVVVPDPDLVPEELRPFLHKVPLGYHTADEVYKIRFLGTGAILRPTRREPGWHRSPLGTAESESYGYKTGTLISPILPPGLYGSRTSISVEDYNTRVIAVRPPGPCITCRGDRGDRVHFAHFNTGNKSINATGLVCKGCLKETFAQWEALVNAFQEPEEVEDDAG